MAVPPGTTRFVCGALLALWVLVGDVAAAEPRPAGRPALPPAPPAESPSSVDAVVTPALPPSVVGPLLLDQVAAVLARQTKEHAQAKSAGCLHCHIGSHDPHLQPDRPLAIQIGCVDCHGGDAGTIDVNAAHVHPRYPDVWQSSANPVRAYTVLNYESPEFIRFVNPGDLRVAHLSCGVSGCHEQQTLEVKKSMMTHGCMLWGAALYNNGATPSKWSRYGESYSMHGVPQRLQTVPPPTPEETATKGVLPFLDPLPRYQVTQPGNVLRIFERGGRFNAEVGIPERLEEPGRPRQRLSNRGLGTLNRTDPVFIGLQKTRLLDPTLNFMGTNDHPGDFRSSGCTACHVVYANDRSRVHSGPYARFGNMGRAAALPDGEHVLSVDPTIRKDESGHPIAHRFVTAIPSSQCIICHMHPGTNVMNTYLGYMWWDQESDGAMMYPTEEHPPTSEEFVQAQMSDPNEISVRGRWKDPAFLENLTDLNPQMRHNHFSDFHGHGWVFKAVFKKDRRGNHLDHRGEIIPHVTADQRQLAVTVPELMAETRRRRDEKTDEELQQASAGLEQLRDGIPVHMLDVHLEKGMHCVDCHFIQDVHGNTKLYGEVRAAIEIRCEDCHGTAAAPAWTEIEGRRQLRTNGPAATDRPGGAPRGRDLAAMRTPFGKRRFEFRGDKVIQNSMVEADMSWEVPQVVDTINPDSDRYNALAALAKTIRLGQDGSYQWGDVPADHTQCAHDTGAMSCIACHSSWNASCYGCHLPQKANKKLPDLHNEGDVTRNFVSYNFQTLRDDVYMLAKDGNVTGNRIGPARSSCAVHVTSYNQNRESIYTQQQTISADGLSGIAFSTNVPHTVRGRQETKNCSDCHLSANNDNNAVVAQLLMQGTNFMNFIGRYCWTAAGEHGLFGVIVTERDEPQAVIGSSLHQAAYPERFQHHIELGGELEHAHEHPGNDIVENLRPPFDKPEILSVLSRGEYVYAACGKLGVRIFDVAFIDHKGFSERIVTAPVSPLGQRFYVRTKYATAVAAPTTIAPDPTRKQSPENFEPAVPALYGYIYATDLYEGLILIGAGTLLDGNPRNNFVQRDVTFNPKGLLNGARALTIAGNYAYVGCDAGLVTIDISQPTELRVVNVVGHEFVQHPHAVQVQFRYAFVCDDEGLKVLDVTQPSTPRPVAQLPLRDAHSVYVARNYAYVAAGQQGLVIVDVTNPEAPFIDQVYNENGCINDTHDVKLGIYYASQFAFLADGHNGLRVVQLTSPETPGWDSFLPRPSPRLIATYPIPKGGHALAVSEGVDRDRAVDESGNQIAVFGRVGARPLNLHEQQRMYLRRDNGQVYKVPEAKRDFGIPDRTLREWELEAELVKLYGPNSLRRTTATPETARP